jgi:hypothetical protein
MAMTTRVGRITTHDKNENFLLTPTLSSFGEEREKNFAWFVYFAVQLCVFASLRFKILRVELNPCSSVSIRG